MPNKGQDLEDEHEVMRYVPFRLLRKDEDGNVLGFLGDAFKLKDNEDELSLNWLEHFNGSRSQRIESSVHTFRRTLEVRPKAAFGVATVGKVKSVALEYDCPVRLVYAPIEKPMDKQNFAHAEIRRLPRDGFELFEAMALDAFTELIPNSSIP